LPCPHLPNLTCAIEERTMTSVGSSCGVIEHHFRRRFDAAARPMLVKILAERRCESFNPSGVLGGPGFRP
jgi:hypothetical protein